MGLLGREIPAGVDGRDASALFRGNAVEDWDDVAVIRSTQGKPWVSVISNDLKLVFSVSDEPWLFDLGKDPHEMTNRIRSADYRGSIRQLIAQLKAYDARVGDSYLQAPLIKEQIQSLLR